MRKPKICTGCGEEIERPRKQEAKSGMHMTCQIAALETALREAREACANHAEALRRLRESDLMVEALLMACDSMGKRLGLDRSASPKVLMDTFERYCVKTERERDEAREEVARLKAPQKEAARRIIERMRRTDDLGMGTWARLKDAVEAELAQGEGEKCECGCELSAESRRLLDEGIEDTKRGRVIPATPDSEGEVETGLHDSQKHQGRWTFMRHKEGCGCFCCYERSRLDAALGQIKILERWKTDLEHK